MFSTTTTTNWPKQGERFKFILHFAAEIQALLESVFMDRSFGRERVSIILTRKARGKGPKKQNWTVLIYLVQYFVFALLDFCTDSMLDSIRGKSAVIFNLFSIIIITVQTRLVFVGVVLLLLSLRTEFNIF